MFSQICGPCATVRGPVRFYNPRIRLCCHRFAHDCRKLIARPQMLPSLLLHTLLVSFHVLTDERWTLGGANASTIEAGRAGE